MEEVENGERTMMWSGSFLLLSARHAGNSAKVGFFLVVVVVVVVRF
jgi:hypothetical protein